MKSDKYCIPSVLAQYFHQKNLQQFNQVIIIMEENMIVIRDPKIFVFIFIDLKMLMIIWSLKLNLS